MPNYSYICKACNTSFNKIITYTQYDNPYDIVHAYGCPICGSFKTERDYKTDCKSKIIYKGSGFYSTDYNKVEDKG